MPSTLCLEGRVHITKQSSGERNEQKYQPRALRPFRPERQMLSPQFMKIQNYPNPCLQYMASLFVPTPASGTSSKSLTGCMEVVWLVSPSVLGPTFMSYLHLGTNVKLTLSELSFWLAKVRAASEHGLRCGIRSQNLC